MADQLGGLGGLKSEWALRRSCQGPNTVLDGMLGSLRGVRFYLFTYPVLHLFIYHLSVDLI